MNFFCHFSFLIFTLRLAQGMLSHCLSDHSVRPRQHSRRNHEADLFRRFQIDDQLKLLRLLYREVSRFGAF